MLNIKISKDFSNTPGGRYVSEGPNSGEAFRKEVLIDIFNQAKEKNEKIFIDLDDLYGSPTSFLEESFGGLVRELNDVNIVNIFEFKSDDRPKLIEKIIDYMRNALE